MKEDSDTEPVVWFFNDALKEEKQWRDRRSKLSPMVLIIKLISTKSVSQKGYRYGGVHLSNYIYSGISTMYFHTVSVAFFINKFVSNI
jgi:hypothetical protein